jgi:hypothetical protein
MKVELTSETCGLTHEIVMTHIKMVSAKIIIKDLKKKTKLTWSILSNP